MLVVEHTVVDGGRANGGCGVNGDVGANVGGENCGGGANDGRWWLSKSWWWWWRWWWWWCCKW